MLLTLLWDLNEMRSEQRPCFEVTCQHLPVSFDLTFVSRSDISSKLAPGSRAGLKSGQRWPWSSTGIFGMLLIWTSAICPGTVVRNGLQQTNANVGVALFWSSLGLVRVPFYFLRTWQVKDGGEPWPLPLPPPWNPRLRRSQYQRKKW